MPSTVDRVAAAAQNVKLLRLLLSVLAFPFYLLGSLVGLVAVVAMWIVAAAQVGYSDVRKRDHEASA
jgi:hypothetical protein